MQDQINQPSTEALVISIPAELQVSSRAEAIAYTINHKVVSL